MGHGSSGQRVSLGLREASRNAIAHEHARPDRAHTFAPLRAVSSQPARRDGLLGRPRLKRQVAIDLRDLRDQVHRDEGRDSEEGGRHQGGFCQQGQSQRGRAKRRRERGINHNPKPNIT